MRRYIPILALALCVCLLAACGVEDALTDIRRQIEGSGAAVTPDPEDPMAPQNAPEDPAYGEGAAIGDGTISTEDVPAPADLPDFTALTVDECVEAPQPGEHALPRITLDCPGAEEINAAIDSAFSSVAEDPLCDLRYEAAKGAGGRILSVVMIQGGPNDWTEYTPYNLDLLSGQALTGPELLALLGQDENELRNLQQALLGDEFTRQFGTGEGIADAAFFQGQRDRTTSPDNTQTDRIWFGGDGTLCFAGRIYGLAGAEYYEYPLSTGLVF